jgi:hypothetical protein
VGEVRREEANVVGADNEKPPTEVDGRVRTPEGGARYEMTMKL